MPSHHLLAFLLAAHHTVAPKAAAATHIQGGRGLQVIFVIVVLFLLLRLIGAGFRSAFSRGN
ncbi:MAG TPA: hypothetical protein VMV92_37330 [Streptosporangiaceae bacterium]|nr:hypothetical protein [Streptosporangiaceae bacterium]